MEKHPVSSFLDIVRSGVLWLKNERSGNANVGKFSFYRYDSTGRLLHIGPDGEILENDSTFQKEDFEYKQSVRSM